MGITNYSVADEVEGIPYRMDNYLCGGSLNTMITMISGGRIAMVNTQIGQYVPTLDAEPMQITTGCEEGYAQACWDVRIKAQGAVRIKDIVDRYSDSTRMSGSSPGRLVTYVELDTNKIGSVFVPKYMSHHTSFGFHLKPIAEKFAPHNTLSSETDKILANSPSRDKDGNFKFGREVNTAYIGTFGTNEDGAEAAMSVKDMYKFELYQTIDIHVESNFALLNLYGNENYYKPLPSVGDYLCSSGLVAAKRELKKAFSLITTRNDELMKVRRPFDQEIYSHHNGEVVDIEVIKDGKPSNLKAMPTGMVDYLDMLANTNKAYHEKVLELDRQYWRDARSGNAEYVRDPSWHIAVRDAEKIIRSKSTAKTKAIGTMDDVVIDGYFIRITIRKIGSPKLGYKYTGLQGEKYVICNFRPDNEMACDKWGRFAHFHVNPVGVINRNNPSQLFECYIKDACFHTRRNMLEMQANGAHETDLWDYLLKFYELISPNTYRLVTEKLPPEQRMAHLRSVLEHRIDLEEPVGAGYFGIPAMRAIRGTVYEPPRDHVTIGELDGTLVQSEAKVRVANKYIYPLEKIGSDSSACNIPLKGSTGFATKVNSKQKKTSQMSNTANRVFGESEFRDLFAKLGSKIVRIIILTHSSASAAKHMAEQMMDKVGFIDSEKIPKTESRGLALLRHILSTFGFDLTKTKDNE